MLTPNALILGLPWLEGFRLTCFNTFYYLGKQNWSNLTLALAPLAAHSESRVEGNRSDAIWLIGGGAIPEALRFQTTFGGHVVYIKPSYPFAYHLSHSWPSGSVRLEDQTEFLYLDCGATSSEQLDKIRLLIDAIKKEPPFSISISLEEPVPNPFDFMYASIVYKFVMAMITSVMLIVTFLGFKCLIEHWTYRKFVNKNNKPVFEGASFVWAVLVIESFSLLFLTACEIATGNGARASPVFTRDIIGFLFTYLQGTSLFTTMLVWKYWGSVLEKMNLKFNDKLQRSRRSCSDCKFYCISLFFLFLDIFQYVLVKTEAYGRLHLLIFVMSAFVSLSTFVGGILFLMRARKILIFLKSIKSEYSSNVGVDDNQDSDVIEKRILYLSRLGRISGMCMVFGIIIMVLFILDGSISNVPIKYALFRSSCFVMRTGISATQILICRLPYRNRNQMKTSLSNRSTLRESSKGPNFASNKASVHPTVSVSK